jgi:hypothetical protein
MPSCSRSRRTRTPDAQAAPPAPPYHVGVVSWGEGPGVVELPDGRRIRGRGLRRPMPAGPLPEFGVYLLGRDPGPLAWENRWVRWRDFRTPTDTGDALGALEEAYRRSATERVEVACGGGVGRTGTALAAIAVLAGVPPDEAVAWVRHRYDPHAVETLWQRRWVLRLEPGREERSRPSAKTPAPGLAPGGVGSVSRASEPTIRSDAERTEP